MDEERRERSDAAPSSIWRAEIANEEERGVRREGIENEENVQMGKINPSCTVQIRGKLFFRGQMTCNSNPAFPFEHPVSPS